MDIKNILQQDPHKVTTWTLLAQRLLITFVVAGLTAIAASVASQPELFGGAAFAQILYLVLTTIKDYLNPKIPNDGGIK